MTQETTPLILYRLERAHEALQEADILLEQGHTNTYVNPALLCMFLCSFSATADKRPFFCQAQRYSGVVSSELCIHWRH